MEISSQTEVVKTETFAPILYVMRYTDFDAVLEAHNAVPQGLSSSIFTNDLREAEAFLSARGSDCGYRQRQHRPVRGRNRRRLRGEKETGGAARAGSDAWKATCAAPPTPSTTSRSAASAGRQLRRGVRG